MFYNRLAYLLSVTDSVVEWTYSSFTMDPEISIIHENKKQKENQSDGMADATQKTPGYLNTRMRMEKFGEIQAVAEVHFNGKSRYIFRCQTIKCGEEE